MHRQPGDTFEKLEVWQRAHALSIEIYRQLTTCADWGFKDQITRAANSIADNVAEGAERLSRAEYRQFVGIAKVQPAKPVPRCSEPPRWATSLKSKPLFFATNFSKISRMLHGLIKSLER